MNIEDFKGKTFHGQKLFAEIWEKCPVGTVAWKVKVYDGDGRFYGSDYTFDYEQVHDLKAVSHGYLTETYKLTKKGGV